MEFPPRQRAWIGRGRPPGVRRLVSDALSSGSAINRKVTREDSALWRPLSLTKTFRDATHSRAARRLLFAWLTLTLVCVVLGIYQVKLGWNALPVHMGPIQFSLTVYPPLVICVWMGPM